MSGARDNSEVADAPDPDGPGGPGGRGGDRAGAPGANRVAGARRRPRILVAAAVVVALVGVTVSAGRWLDGSEAPGVAISEDRPPAPPVDLADLRDPERRVTLAAFRGQPVVLNFFASTCVPCRKEMPDLQATADELAGRVAFVGIDHQDGRVGALELLAETGVRYPAGYDPRGEVARAYGLIGLPTTVFISADGAVVARRTGAMTRVQLRRTIERVFPEVGGTR